MKKSIDISKEQSEAIDNVFMYYFENHKNYRKSKEYFAWVDIVDQLIDKK